jgi:hypothetical protein
VHDDVRDRRLQISAERRVGPVLPGAVRSEPGDDDLRDDLERGDADDREGARQPELALTREDDRDHAEGEPHVLAHEQEGEADHDDSAAPPAVERVDQPRDERDRERDLVEVGLDEALQRPPEQVRPGGQEGESRPEATLAERVDGEDRRRDQDAEDEREHARVRIQKSGASTARIGLKWSPSSENPTPLSELTGAWKRA